MVLIKIHSEQLCNRGLCELISGDKHQLLLLDNLLDIRHRWSNKTVSLWVKGNVHVQIV